MEHGHRTNIEIKARCADPSRARQLLARSGARYVGLDQQRDTYFESAVGRLKVREGRIESGLIFYDREDTALPGRSDVLLHETADPSVIVEILSRVLRMDIVVAKDRHIYRDGRVKIHVDEVEGLGSFVEVEAIDSDGSAGVDALEHECRRYLEILSVDNRDLVPVSYSDLLREAIETPMWLR